MSVPIAPGVPDLDRAVIGIGSTSGILSKVLSADVFGILGNYLGKRWAIIGADNSSGLAFDSVVSFEYRGQERIATHPVEVSATGTGGSFAAYNKVAVPFDIRMRVTCTGQGGSLLTSVANLFGSDLFGSGGMTRDKFLDRLDAMKSDVKLYNIVTPDKVYKNVNLEGFNYSKQDGRGVSLLIVDLMFMEIRTSAKTTYTSTAQPSGATTTNNGTANPTTPTDNQTAQASKSTIQ